MSYYAKVNPRFWTGDTGRKLRGDPERQVVATYLITSPHANMLGFYYLPVDYISTDTGLSVEGASKALQRLSEAGFCRYDEVAEVVWVVEMARIQIGEHLMPKDKRCTAVEREYGALPNNRFLKDFFARYGAAFHLKAARGFKGACQDPSKPAAVTAAASKSATAGKDCAADAARRPRMNGHKIDFDPARGLFTGISEEDQLRWQSAYPAIAIPLEIEKAAAWLKANPANRKKNNERFLVNWFGRAQERAPRVQQARR